LIGSNTADVAPDKPTGRPVDEERLAPSSQCMSATTPTDRRDPNQWLAKLIVDPVTMNEEGPNQRRRQWR
jgi:hypothetical protein